MAKVEREHLLTAAQMARFVVDGYLQMEGIVPQALNEKVHHEQIHYSGKGYDWFWHESETIKEIFELPQVNGIIESLVGKNPVYDHSYQHVVAPKHLKAQNWHADSVIDTRPFAFDIQCFYFSHDTPIEMGPTLILPGSHLRRVNNYSIGRYKNIVGQRQMACKAGTIAFLHHGLWHCAQPNYTDTTRYVFKLRLQPGQEQRNLFNTDGYDTEEIRQIFREGYHPWLGNDDRAEHVQRAKLWRYVVGNDSVDLSFENALTRMKI
ncbi:phytanoyl-CoA dioxygenase family protein [Ammoniphilus sp. YIM 78166]|uniref:phytanoyl-CoA dioxygenase family protein n=1 Tax=Ammoniphilus sp. YIM 78166 TaxID=1644106 RepID=UPI00106FE48F|nr:phytanoyl-CoA dioxygenase family protein [Ammoniphilus sp. YIM 78166]